MKNILITAFFSLAFAFSSKAQLEKVIVEKYYVSDANDATDTSGGGVQIGRAHV